MRTPDPFALPQDPALAAALLDELVRADFTAFSHVALHLVLGSEAPTRIPWHVQAMGHLVQAIAEGEKRRVLVTIAPRHLKSSVMSVCQIAWRLGREPALKVMLVSYSKALSADLLAKVRAIMEHPWYRSAFPEVGRLAVARKDLLQTASGGKVIATSMSAGFTGMGADLIIVDDPLSAQSAFSERRRAHVLRVFREGLHSRLDDPATGAMVVVMQRLHEEDLIGHLKLDARWEELRIPLVAEEAQSVLLRPGLHHHREARTTIDCERVPIALAEEIQRTVGSAVYSAQYQQDPQPADGHLLRLGNVGTYPQPLAEYDEQVIAVDTALETGEGNDYTACVVLGRSGHRIHVLHVERDRLSFVEQLYLVCNLAREYPQAQILVEAANTGVALIQELRRVHALSVTPMPARRAKEERAVAVAPLLENGDVSFPREAPWLGAFTRELRAFPHGANDDMVDAFVHGLTYLRRHLRRLEPVRYPAPERSRAVRRERPVGRARPQGMLRRP